MHYINGYFRIIVAFQLQIRLENAWACINVFRASGSKHHIRTTVALGGCCHVWHCPSGLQPHWIWRHYILPVGSYRRSKKGRKWRLRRLRFYISRAPFGIESPSFTETSKPTCPTFALTGYDVTNYFQSEVSGKKPSEIPPQTASGGISR